MGTFFAVLSFIASVCKAIAAGLSMKQAADTKAVEERDFNAIKRHEQNTSDIDDAFAGGVQHESDNATGGQRPTPPSPPAV